MPNLLLPHEAYLGPLSTGGGDGDGGGGTGVVTGISVAGTNSAVINTGVLSVISLNGTVYWDDGSFHTDGSGVICDRPGRYLVIGQVGWSLPASEAGSRVGIEIYLNGNAAVPRIVSQSTVANTVSPVVQASAIINLVEGDAVHLRGVQNTGEDRTPSNNWLSLQAVGAGATGAQGPPGTAGADGAPGPPGSGGILVGVGAPSNDLGVDGDFYFDDAANILYGPKSADAWDTPRFTNTDTDTWTTTMTGVYRLAMEYKFLIAAQITGARWKRTADAAANPKQLYLFNPAGTLIATSDFTSETAGVMGWVRAGFPTPIPVNPNDQFIIAFDHPATGSTGYTAPPGPTMLDPTKVTYVQARYAAGTGGSLFPNNVQGDVNRFVDIEYRPPGTNVWPIALESGGGGGGSGLRTYEQSFASASTTWVVNHNFNSVAVEVNAFDPTGLIQYEPEVELTSVNTATIRWYYPTTGIARVLG
jgi:hypothetical protein